MATSIIQIPQCKEAQAIGSFLHLNARHRMFTQNLSYRHTCIRRSGAELLAVNFLVRVLVYTMQKGSVSRVDPGLKGLQPISFQKALECEAMRVWRRKTIHISQRWRIAHA